MTSPHALPSGSTYDVPKQFLHVDLMALGPQLEGDLVRDLTLIHDHQDPVSR